MFSACLDDRPTAVLRPIEEPIAWITIVEDREQPLMAEPTTYLGADGRVVSGYRVWWPRADADGAFARFLPNGHDQAVAYTKLEGEDFHAYVWEAFWHDAIGFYLINETLSQGEEGITVTGLGPIAWKVGTIKGSRMTIDWRWINGSNGTSAYSSTFEKWLPVPIETVVQSAMPTIHRSTSFVRAWPRDATVDPVRSLPEITNVPRDALHEIPGGYTFTFEDATLVWRQDERYALAQTWFDAHPLHDLVDLRFSVIDENEGNGTVWFWQAKYAAGHDMLTVGAGWRVTHPDAIAKRQYPLYDQCPEGCIDPYGGEPRNATLPNLDPPGEWPPSGITTRSALERLKALDPTVNVTGFHWKRIDNKGDTLFPQPRLVLYMDRIESIWNPEPDLPDALGGALQRIHYPNSLYSEQHLERGHFTRIQTDKLIF